MEETPSYWVPLTWTGNVLFWAVLVILLTMSNQPSDSTYVMSCALISVIACFLVLNPWQSDPFEPIKLVATLYGGSFGIGPLILAPEGNYNIPYLGLTWERLLSEGALSALAGLVVLLTGYYLTAMLSTRKQGIPHDLSQGERRIITLTGVALLGIGSLSYALLIHEAGGFSHFVFYASGRADIFQNAFGAFYWVSFFLLSGLSAIGCAHAPRHPFLVIGLAGALGLLYLPFQGREEVIAPIICGLLLLHYGYRRIGLKWIAIAACGLVLAASFIGYFRTVDKMDAYKNTEAVVDNYSDKLKQHLMKTLAQNVEQMDALLIAMRYVERTKQLPNGQTLMAWLEPIDRHVLGDVLDSQQAGRMMTILVHPEHEWSQTALSPSLIGELYLNFSLTGLIAGMFAYGMFMRFLYNKVLTMPSNPSILMLYPYTLWIMAKMVVDGSAHLFRPIVVVLPTILVYLYLSARSTPHEEQTSSKAIEGTRGDIQHQW